MTPYHTTYRGQQQASAHWVCNACGYWHRAEHAKCYWCYDSGYKSSPARPMWKPHVAPPAIPASWNGWQQQRKRGGRQSSSPTRRALWPTPAESTYVSNRWSSLVDESDNATLDYPFYDDAAGDLATVTAAAPEGPTEAEIRAVTRKLAVVQLRATQRASCGEDCFIDSIEALEEQIAAIDLISYAAKPLNARRQSAGDKRKRIVSLAAKATNTCVALEEQINAAQRAYVVARATRDSLDTSLKDLDCDIARLDNERNGAMGVDCDGPMISDVSEHEEVTANLKMKMETLQEQVTQLTAQLERISGGAAL